MLSFYHIPAELMKYVQQEIIPVYDTFDKAHKTDHVEKVIAENLRLAQHYPVNYNMVYVTAAYHDTGLSGGREYHHLLSGEIIMSDPELRLWFTEAELLIMKEAVEDHRASNKQPPRSIYGRIVAEADRIIDPDVTLRRTVQYGLSHYPELTMEEQYSRFRKHLSGKYGEKGYLRLWIPESDNAARLSELRLLIGNEKELKTVFHRIYTEENKDNKSV